MKIRKHFLFLIFFFLSHISNAQTIAAGKYHSLFLCNSNEPFACGNNSYGQLGDGTLTNSTIPVRSSSLTGIIAMAAGEDHSLFLKNDGTVWACGSNNSGQLGDGTTTSKVGPVHVSSLTGIIAIAAGYYHSLFLKNDSTVWACGYNSDGQLGDGTTTTRYTPIKVSSLTGIIAIAAGKYHSLFLKNDGTVWACGYNFFGQLGDGTTTDRRTPVQATSLTGIIAIAAGGYHSLFLKNIRTVWACGNNYYGQLGDGTSGGGNKRITPFQITSFISTTIAIAGGEYHSLFLQNDGTVWACGNNWYGQLGDGTLKEPYPIHVSSLLNITAIATRDNHSLFLKNDSTVWACGINNYGQLGDGTTTNRNTPVQVQQLCTTHYIHGNLYDDTNNDCVRQGSEQGLPFIAVVAAPGNLYSSTNDTGYYSLGVNDSVNYTIAPIIPQRFSHMLKNPCPANYSVYMDANSPMDTSGFDFGFEANLCHQLRVAIGESRKRRCFKNTMNVSYWNEGLAAVNGVEVRVKFDKYDIPVSASMSYTYDATDSSWVFSLGTLNAGQRGSITIIDSVACIGGITGLTQCTHAWILPPNQCLIDSTTGSGWDKSSVKAEGSCVNDTVRFVIYNTGDPVNGDMDSTSQYRIYADNVLVQTGNFQLAGGDSLVITIVSGGTTIRLEADQRPGHPGNSHPRTTVERCGTDGLGNFSTGEVNKVPQDDVDVDVDIDCLPIRDSYDPNTKGNSPEGIGASKIVLPNTPVEFIIRFQNTGNDTAYKVVIVDTLSSDYDLSTLELGASSHLCSVGISGEGRPVLTFTFNNINLADSLTNEPMSHGFVKYKITPKDTVPLGTQINNTASIYFDFNFPVVTNNAFITLENYSTGCLAIHYSQSPAICNGQSVTVGSNAYTASGTYTDTLTATNGCDSIVTTNLSVLSNSTFSQNPIICNGQSITVGSNTYTASGTYTDTLTAANGCDSIVTTNLTVLSNSIFSQSQTVCNGQSITVGSSIYTTSGTYTDTLTAANSCDSIVTTNLTVLLNSSFSQSPIICNGENFTVGSNTYTTSGTYKDTLIAANGCDSIVITILVVKSNSSFVQSLTINNGDSIKVGNNIYNVTGTYVDTMIAANGCDSVVTTFLAVLTSIQSIIINSQFSVSIFPNPFIYSVILRINPSAQERNYNLKLFDIFGKTVFQSVIRNSQSEIHLNLPIGIYFYQVKNNEQIIGSGKLVRE